MFQRQFFKKNLLFFVCASFRREVVNFTSISTASCDVGLIKHVLLKQQQKNFNLQYPDTLINKWRHEEAEMFRFLKKEFHYRSDFLSSRIFRHEKVRGSEIVEKREVNAMVQFGFRF